MAKHSITLDDIFRQTNENIDNTDNTDNINKNIDKNENTKNTSTKKYKTKNNTNKTDNKIDNSKNDIVSNNIDNILNNGLVKFENKIQTSMYFVCYKAINSFCNSIKDSHNIIIPKEFIDNQIVSVIPNIIKEYTGNLKKRCKKIINLDMICIGRKLDNKQCTRKKHNDSDFCKSHFIKLSNGRIDQPTKVNLRNKRGRKRKVEFDPRQYDNDYITLWEDIINGEKVLIDINNNIYTFDLQTPQYIGKKDIFNKLDITTILNKISSNKLDKEEIQEIHENEKIEEIQVIHENEKIEEIQVTQEKNNTDVKEEINICHPDLDVEYKIESNIIENKENNTSNLINECKDIDEPKINNKIDRKIKLNKKNTKTKL